MEALPSISNQSQLAQVAQMADEAVRANTFKDYQEGIAENTKTRQKYDLIVFNKFLGELGYQCDVDTLMTDISSWAFITYGMIELFKQWQLQQGYAIGTVNVRIGTVRKYATLAYDAGVISSERYDRIQAKAKLVSPKQAVRIDEKRPVIRRGYKKATAIPFTSEQVDRLISEHPDTPIGARDAFLMVLLYRLILRCGEVARLSLDNYNRRTGTLRFYRPKVDKWTNLELPPDLKAMADRYFEVCKPDDPVRNPTRCLIMGSNNKGQVLYTMQERSITRRVEVLCERILGVSNASAHDGRHSGTTELVRGGTDIETVMAIGGWATPTIPLKYVNAQKVANKGAKYGKVE
jgi:integrase